MYDISVQLKSNEPSIHNHRNNRIEVSTMCRKLNSDECSELEMYTICVQLKFGKLDMKDKLSPILGHLKTRELDTIIEPYPNWVHLKQDFNIIRMEI